MLFTATDLGITLSPLKVRLGLKAAGRRQIDKPLHELEYTPGEALILWLADWLGKRKPISEEQQGLLLTEFGERIKTAADDVESSVATTITAHQMVVVDNTLAGISGQTDYLDLRTGERVKGPKQMPVEIYSVNLTALYCLHRDRRHTRAEG